MLNEITLETSRGENPALWNESESSQLLMLFSHSVMSDSSRPCGLQHTRLLCSSPSPGACSNSCPLSQWCHPTISSCVIPFSSCLQSFPASGHFLSFPNKINQYYTEILVAIANAYLFLVLKGNFSFSMLETFNIWNSLYIFYPSKWLQNTTPAAWIRSRVFGL